MRRRRRSPGGRWAIPLAVAGIGAGWASVATAMFGVPAAPWLAVLAVGAIVLLIGSIFRPWGYAAALTVPTLAVLILLVVPVLQLLTVLLASLAWRTVSLDPLLFEVSVVLGPRGGFLLIRHVDPANVPAVRDLLVTLPDGVLFGVVALVGLTGLALVHRRRRAAGTALVLAAAATTVSMLVVPAPDRVLADDRADWAHLVRHPRSSVGSDVDAIALIPAEDGRAREGLAFFSTPAGGRGCWKAWTIRRTMPRCSSAGTGQASAGPRCPAIGHDAGAGVRGDGRSGVRCSRSTKP